MKTLVYFEPNNINDFEGARIRKSIKGALELRNIKYTDGLLDSYDIAHFISPDDEIRIHHVLEKNKPIIVSALYSEADKKASYFEYKSKRNGDFKINLRYKGLKLLNNANVVLVPSESARDILVNRGVTTDIRIVVPPINLSRFDSTRNYEMQIFNRYFSRKEDRDFVIGIGEKNNRVNDLSTFIKCAKAFPNLDFYYIMNKTKWFNFKRSIMLSKFAMPSNLYILDLLGDDLYRSALMNAKAFLYTGDNPLGAVSLADAMAAKCQIIMKQSRAFRTIEENNKTAFLATTDEDLIAKMRKILEDKNYTTVEQAYNFISKHTLDKYGEELIKIYKEQISLKK